MLYPQEIIEEVRMGNDIVDVISAYVTLKQKGNSFFGLCPFHNEKSPSFSVTPDRQMYYCFGCGAAGNAYSFIMQMENIGFLDAVSVLADRIHYALPEKNMSGDAMKTAQLKETLFDIHKISARFFYNNLQQHEGRIAVEYLDRRDVSPQMRVKFGLGYSGIKRDGLLNHLLNAGYDIDIILKSGLVLAGKKGGYYDRFSERLMFPIFDVLGKVVGFGGRALGQNEPKYLNSPDTPIFDKSHNLYGINFARRVKPKPKTFIIVEGYMDVIAMHQAGFTHAVAALGTAFNKDHAALLRKHVDTVIIAFDSDEAGVKAAKRAIPVLDQSGFDTKVLTLTQAKDPDEYIKQFGREAFAALLQTAKNHIAFQVDEMKTHYNLENMEEKVQFTLEVSKILAALDSPVKRDAYTKDVAQITNISREAIMSEIDKLTDQPLKNAKTSRKQGMDYIGRNKSGEKGVIEAKKGLLNLMALNANICLKIRPYLAPEEMDDPVYGELLQLLYTFADELRDVYPAELLNYFETVEEQKKVSEVFIAVTPLDDDASLEKAVNDFLKNIKRAYVVKKMNICDKESDGNALQGLINHKRNVENLYIPISDG